jgi:hypothetical protein
LAVDLASMKQTPAQYQHNVGLVRDYPNLPKVRGGADRVAEAFINHVADNLKWLWNQIPEAVRERSKDWYVGGNRLVNDLANQYGLKPSQVAGVIAGMSPQKDWYSNLDLAQRLLETIKTHGDHVAGKEMARAFAERPSLQKYKPLWDLIKGNSYNDLDKALAGG